MTPCKCGCGRPPARGMIYATRECAPYGMLGITARAPVKIPPGYITVAKMASVLGCNGHTICDRLRKAGLSKPRNGSVPPIYKEWVLRRLMAHPDPHKGRKQHVYVEKETAPLDSHQEGR